MKNLEIPRGTYKRALNRIVSPMSITVANAGLCCVLISIAYILGSVTVEIYYSFILVFLAALYINCLKMMNITLEVFFTYAYLFIPIILYSNISITTTLIIISSLLLVMIGSDFKVKQDAIMVDYVNEGFLRINDE